MLFFGSLLLVLACKFSKLFHSIFIVLKFSYVLVASLRLVTCNLRVESHSPAYAIFTKYSNSDGTCSGDIGSTLAFAIGECVPIKDFAVTGYNSIVVNYDYFLISVTSYSSSTCTGTTALTGPVPPSTCVTSIRVTYSSESNPPVTSVAGKYIQLR